MLFKYKITVFSDIYFFWGGAIGLKLGLGGIDWEVPSLLSTN